MVTLVERSPVTACYVARVLRAACRAAFHRRRALRLNSHSVRQTEMNAELEQWLSELRSDGVEFPDDTVGGANANMWSISVPLAGTVREDDLTAFVLAAAAIRQELVAAHGAAPVTFYAWHDEIAGQLRFSTARCAPESLPFAAPVGLVEHPAEIVQCFLRSQYRDGIPLTTLDARPDDEWEPAATASLALETVKVWALQLA